MASSSRAHPPTASFVRPALGRTIALQPDADGVMRAAIEAVHQTIEVDMSFAALPDGASLRVAYASGAPHPRFFEMRPNEDMGLGGQVLRRRTAVRVEDYPAEQRFTPDFAAVVTDGEGLHSIGCVPLTATGGEVVGLLYGGHRAVASLGDRALGALEEIASFASIGLESVRERADQLELQRLRDHHRLATFLHESVAQSLFGIGVAAGLARRSDDPEAIREALREIDESAAGARTQLRDALHRLSGDDDALDFHERLAAELRLFGRATGCRVRAVHGGLRVGISDLAEDLIVDAAVEGLRNAVKHAGARAAAVRVEYAASSVNVVVTTEIHDPAVVVPDALGEAAISTGTGTATLARRARALRGTLESRPDGQGGRDLRLSLPIGRIDA